MRTDSTRAADRYCGRTEKRRELVDQDVAGGGRPPLALLAAEAVSQTEDGERSKLSTYLWYVLA